MKTNQRKSKNVQDRRKEKLDPDTQWAVDTAHKIVGRPYPSKELVKVIKDNPNPTPEQAQSFVREADRRANKRIAEEDTKRWKDFPAGKQKSKADKDINTALKSIRDEQTKKTKARFLEPSPYKTKEAKIVKKSKPKKK